MMGFSCVGASSDIGDMGRKKKWVMSSNRGSTSGGRIDEEKEVRPDMAVAVV